VNKKRKNVFLVYICPSILCRKQCILAVTKSVETGAITESLSFHERTRTISWCHIVMRTPAQLNLHIDFHTLSAPYLHAAYAANWLHLRDGTYKMFYKMLPGHIPVGSRVPFGLLRQKKRKGLRAVLTKCGAERARLRVHARTP